MKKKLSSIWRLKNSWHAFHFPQQPLTSTLGNDHCLKLLLGVCNTKKNGDDSISLLPLKTFCLFSLSACCRSSSRHSLSAYGSETALDLFQNSAKVYVLCLHIFIHFTIYVYIGFLPLNSENLQHFNTKQHSFEEKRKRKNSVKFKFSQ
jgi:hypothetical protein